MEFFICDYKRYGLIPWNPYFYIKLIQPTAVEILAEIKDKLDKKTISKNDS